jgi:hypothetical protein
VKWDDYRQILAHYYTGAQFLGEGAPFAPDDRWNLLKYEGIPNTMTPGQQITPTLIWLQNTSTQPWDNAVLGYRWSGTDGVNTWTSGDWVEAFTTLSTAMGDDEKLENVVTITAPADGKSYNTLHLDVKVLDFRVRLPGTRSLQAMSGCTGTGAAPARSAKLLEFATP